MEYKIAVLKGDGIGSEIVDVTVKVLEKIGEKFNHKFSGAANAGQDAGREPPFYHFSRQYVDGCL